jgi:glycosyltransferase involved in cell wall biosynthesis
MSDLRAAKLADREHARRNRVAIVCDLREENWHSMNLVAEMLLKDLSADYSEEFTPTRVCPPMQRIFARDGVDSGLLFNADRLFNRFWTYPRHVVRLRQDFDLFHVVDHSYAQLVHQLPAERTIITCHDLDTFRCLLNPDGETRSWPYRMMTKRVLEGFMKAARVTCDSFSTRDELLSHGLLPPESVEVIYNGVSPNYSPLADPTADTEAERLLGSLAPDNCDILHVGSTIPRKRIDVLLRVFAELHREFPAARLVRVGGRFVGSQLRLIQDLYLKDSIIVMPFLDKRILAAVYRRAALLLQTSEREGFGLPVIEAMACGLPVLASDLPVLREVGGRATDYCAVGDVVAWTEAATRMLKERQEDQGGWATRQEESIAHASLFSWAEYTRKMVAIYRQLL